MSLAYWRLTADRASILFDALGATVEGETYTPLGLVSKCWAVPHLSMLVSSWGWTGEALALWMRLAVSDRMRNLEDVAQQGPAILRETSAAHGPPGDLGKHTTVIVFGFDEAADRMGGVLFAGVNDFAAIRVVKLDLCQPSIKDLPADDWERALALQAYDRSRPEHDQDLIAGPLTRADLFLEKGQPVITMRRLGVLPPQVEPSVSATVMERC